MTYRNIVKKDEWCYECQEHTVHTQVNSPMEELGYESFRCLSCGVTAHFGGNK